MPKPKTITPYAMKSCAVEDTIIVRPNGEDLELIVGSDNRRVIYMNQKESLLFVLTILKQAQKKWGDDFLVSVEEQIEVM